MSNKGFTLTESLLILALISFLLLLTSMHMPSIAYFEIELNRIREYLIQAQLQAMTTHEVINFSFTQTALQIEDLIIPYREGITSDVFSMKYYADGTISQAKTICFYYNKVQKCFYIQLGSGYIDVR